MRIVVNDIAASSGGALTILESFYRYVRDFGGDHEWVFLLGSPLLEETENIRTVVLPEVKNSWLRRLAFDLAVGRGLIRSLKPDVVFSLQNTLTLGVNRPQVLYVHQPLPFQDAKRFSFFRRHEFRCAVYQHIIGQLIIDSIRRANHTIVQTQWMLEAVVAKSGVSEHRVSRIAPPGLERIEMPTGGIPDSRRFVYPTSNVVYKNNQCLFEACRMLQDEGINDFHVKVTLPHVVPAQDNCIERIGRVTRQVILEELSVGTLVFPSYIETFGLPLLEACSLGSVVLAADCPYARELLRDYVNAYFFNPFSASELAALMKRVILGQIAPGAPREDNVQREEYGWGRVNDVLYAAAQGARARAGRQVEDGI